MAKSDFTEHQAISLDCIIAELSKYDLGTQWRLVNFLVNRFEQPIAPVVNDDEPNERGEG